MSKLNDLQGTPKTLDEAIIRAVMVAGPIGETTHIIHMYVKDFLAQKFNVAYFEADGIELDRLEKLFKLCTDRAKD